MFLYMSPVLRLLRFTHSRKAAYAIWCLAGNMIKIWYHCRFKRKMHCRPW